MSDLTRLAHTVFFTLKNNSAEHRQQLVEACHKYLKPQPGVVLFAAGTRDEGLVREVNVVDFDVALVIVFENRAAHDRYQDDETHNVFISEQKDNWAQVRIFDAHV